MAPVTAFRRVGSASLLLMGGLLVARVLFVLLCFSLPASAALKPGDIVTPANHALVRDHVPPEFYQHVVEGFDDLEMTIVPTEDYRPHPKYIEATAKFACQPRVVDGRLVDYRAGQPFPYSEWAKEVTNHACDLTEDDPHFAQKLAWNVNYRWQGGPGLNIPHWGFSNMRNSGKDTWRVAQGEYRRTYFSGRADLLPETTELEAGTNIEWAEFFDVKTPFDLRGTMFLLFRYTDGTEDQTWAYIPALRRVRRIAATQKSDSLLGTEFTLEDFYLFSGYVWDHAWSFGGEFEYLSSANSERPCFPGNTGSTDPKEFVKLGSNEDWRACRFDPYGALPMVGERWQLRTTFRLDDVPRQEGHPYSKKLIYYDKETLAPGLAVTYDRAGAVYRLIGGVGRWSEDSVYAGDHGKHALLGAAVMIVNVQSKASNLGQFNTSNVEPFNAERARRYYDVTKLKRAGR